MILVYFVLLKVQKFLKITFFSLSKRKSVKKLTQLSTKISKFSYFSFTFKLSGKKKVPLKKYSLEKGVTRKILLEEGLNLRGIENISKKNGGEGVDKKGVEKKLRGL